MNNLASGLISLLLFPSIGAKSFFDLRPKNLDHHDYVNQLIKKGPIIIVNKLTPMNETLSNETPTNENSITETNQLIEKVFNASFAMAINEAFKYHCGVIDGDTIVFRKDANYNNITYSDSKLIEILFPNKNEYSLKNFEAMGEVKRHLSHLNLNMNTSRISSLYKINITEITVGPLISISFDKSSVSKEVTWLCNTFTGTLKGPLLNFKNAFITVGSAAKEGGKIAASATSRAAVYTGGVLASVPEASVEVLQSTGRGIRDFPKNHPKVVHSAQALGVFSAYFSLYMLMIIAIGLI